MILIVPLISVKITSKPSPAIRACISYPRMWAYIFEKDLLSPTVFDTVHWIAIGQTSQTCSQTVCGNVACKNRMHHWKHWDNPFCQLCLTPEEDATHVCMCFLAILQKALTNGMTQFDKNWRNWWPTQIIILAFFLVSNRDSTPLPNL